MYKWVAYSFWIESPNPHENIIWDPLIYKIADGITYMRSPIRSDIRNTHMRSHMIFTRGKRMKIGGL